MEIKKSLRLSVHALVDFMLRSGDIDNRIFNKASMQEGTRLHTQYQQAQTGAFSAEMFLKHTYVSDEYDVTVEGYADGIREALGKVFIEEVKTTVADLETFSSQHAEWHKMQAFIYGHMYALDHGFDIVRIRLIYINQADKKTLILTHELDIDTLSRAIEDLIAGYLRFYRLIDTHIARRDASVSSLPFPFSKFRAGQREMAKYVYALATKGGALFAEAPTGIGKTISTLYPSVLSFGKGLSGKIFYVTAKNSGHEAASLAMRQLRIKGARVSDIRLTAKDKICLTPGAACNPDECPFAKGYYDKIHTVLAEALGQLETFDRENILELARKHEICPFELQLDISLFVDVIIGDYNYVFDPMVYLRRFFDIDASSHFLLVDEAHNLIERSRDMYSTVLTENGLKKMRYATRKLKHRKFKGTLTKLKKAFEAFEVPSTFPATTSIAPGFFLAIDAFLIQAQDVMRKEPSFITEDFKDFYFDANRFLKLSDYFDERFVYYLDKSDKGLSVHMLCLDSSALIAQTMSAFKGRALFSATLAPLDYFIPMLGGKPTDAVLRLPSPFPRDNLLLMVAPTVSTRFKQRAATLDEIALDIELAVSGRLGNYLVFFPSYKYMREVISHLKFKDEINLLVQEQEMSNEEQEMFLLQFAPNPIRTTVGFVVLGGAFSEGIDLIEDRLIGAIIVGVGLPQLGFERDLIKEYFAKTGLDGYAFSYAYPGMNRVMQAVGRVIRSEKDRGIALLIDDRYLEARYRAMFKNEWAHYEAVITPDDISELVTNFWNPTRS